MSQSYTGYTNRPGLIGATGFQSAVVGVQGYAGPSPAGEYGNGVDGTVNMDGTNTFSSFATTSGSAPNFVYTLTRDVVCDTLTVASGKTLNTANYRIIAKTKIQVDGTMTVAGGNASGATGGTAITFGCLGGGQAGVTASGTGSGFNGNNWASGNNLGSMGGTGGAGGTAGANVGGTGGTVSAPKSNAGSGLTLYRLPTALSGCMLTNYNAITGGASGGTGGSATASLGGGSGAGGGCMILAAPIFTGSGTITAAGGNGGNGSTNGAGGGGGGGGWLVMLYQNIAPSLTITAAGGAGGSGAGTGGNGSSGSNGLVIQILN